ncbi:MAG: hypothetical protein CME30_01615 [Gemmatimonadetes bacterium]|nr:hypothetical protein [Gemmatimonadota bacterium]
MEEESCSKTSSDEVLVRLACSERLDATDILIDRYYRICFRTCMTILRDQDHASDACQNCFIKMVKSIDKFRGDGTFRSWLLTIARNESLAILRQKKLRREVKLENDDLQLKEQRDFSQEIFTKIEVSRVRKALDVLPQKQRLAVRWRLDEGLSFKEIGHIIESSEGSARVSYYHGIRKLREILDL